LQKAFVHQPNPATDQLFLLVFAVTQRGNGLTEREKGCVRPTLPTAAATFLHAASRQNKKESRKLWALQLQIENYQIQFPKENIGAELFQDLRPEFGPCARQTFHSRHSVSSDVTQGCYQFI
jgi:hypothetical protein